MAMNNTLTRRKYQRDYTIVSNVFLKDEKLSWKAKGIIAYVCMLPDDWTLNIRDLINRAVDGRDSMYSGIRELENAGYCIKRQRRKPDGTIAGWAYEISDQPYTENPYTANSEIDAPHTEKPYTENPYTENPPLINTNNTNNPSIQNNGVQKDFDANPQLFDNSEQLEEKSKKTLFRNSTIYGLVKFGPSGEPENYDAFFEKFATPAYENVDLVYYFHAVADWSDQRNMKRTANGWLATIRNFIRGDIERNKLHMKNGMCAGQQSTMDVDGACAFLNNNY